MVYSKGHMVYSKHKRVNYIGFSPLKEGGGGVFGVRGLNFCPPPPSLFLFFFFLGGGGGGGGRD